MLTSFEFNIIEKIDKKPTSVGFFMGEIWMIKIIFG